MRAVEFITEEFNARNAFAALVADMRAMTDQLRYMRKEHSVEQVAQATARLQQMQNRARALGASDKELGNGELTREQRQRCAALMAQIEAALAQGQTRKQ